MDPTKGVKATRSTLSFIPVLQFAIGHHVKLN